MGAARAGDSFAAYDVIWTTPSKDSADSMPIGNGDIGLNVWVEEDGDLCFYIGKTDSWDENGRLLKLGRIRVKLSPNPFSKGLPFEQTLKLREGEIAIAAGAKNSRVTLRIWVDANHPAIRVEAAGDCEFEVEVGLETWREVGYLLQRTTISDLYNRTAVDETGEAIANNPYPTVIYPDVIVPGEDRRVFWYHHNIKSAWPVTLKLQSIESLIETSTDPLLGRTFGGSITGEGFVSKSDRVLRSTEARTEHAVSICVLTEHPSTVSEWSRRLDEMIARVDAVEIEAARAAHRKWWDEFWNRSWIRVTGSDEGELVARGYTLQRYMSGWGGRGAYPIKFNGSIFTTPHEGDPDYRQWGPGFWWQNQRLMYWPMTASGDFDLMLPFFKMYLDTLPVARACNRIYYGHEGAHFPETIYFWGSCTNDHYGWDREGRPVSEVAVGYVAREWQGGLELLGIMLDYYSYTQEEKFLAEALLPMADEILTFYDLHYERDADGKIRFEPAQALETWWECVNPMPEVSGLRFVLKQLLELPEKLPGEERREKWQRLLGELPPIPTRTVDGETILAPADSYANKNNIENPELYAVFPYRLYGVGKPDLEMAQRSFDQRLHREGNKGHDQDEIHAAYLGLASLSAQFVARRFGREYLTARFPTFWYGWDWIPDQCHGGAGLIAAQAMLMQCEGKRILLFPAWPKDWDVEFKLHAPFNTTVAGSYRDGRLEHLQVTPESRAADVVVVGPE